jgi:hypothetical protein
MIVQPGVQQMHSSRSVLDTYRLFYFVVNNFIIS